MAQNAPQRRLTAILSADVKDEALQAIDLSLHISRKLKGLEWSVIDLWIINILTW